MTTVFQASISLPVYHTTDYLYEANARAAVEAAGSGSVTEFRVEDNLPDRLPAKVYHSCALNVFESGTWRSVNIF